MGEAKKERMFFPGNQSRGFVRSFLIRRKNTFTKEL